MSGMTSLFVEYFEQAVLARTVMRRIDSDGEEPRSPETFELGQLNFFRNPQTMKNDDSRMMILVTGTQSL